jgi:Ca2+-binding RTX toxin-like protein
LGYHLIPRLLFVFIMLFSAASVFAQADEYPSIQAVLDLPRCSTLAVTNAAEPMRQVASGGSTEYIWDDAWTQQTQYDLLVVPVTTRDTLTQPSPVWRFLYSLQLTNGNQVHFGMRGQTAAHVPPELLADGKRVTAKTITEATHVTGGATTLIADAPGVYNVIVLRVENGQRCRSDLMWLNVGDAPPAGNAPSSLPQLAQLPTGVSGGLFSCNFKLTGSPFTGFATIVPSPDFTATACDDVIHGNNVANIINGVNGNDTVFAYDGDDTLNGNNGNDILNGENGNDTLNGDTGNDVLNGGAGNDMLNGGTGDDWLTGDDGNDVLNGGRGNDILRGGDGDDEFTGGSAPSVDYVDGGAGRDHLIETTTDLTVIVNGTNGDLIGLDVFDQYTNVEMITTGAGNDEFGLSGTGGGDAANSLVMDAGGGSNTFIFFSGISGYWSVGGSGTETLTFSGLSSGVTLNLNNTTTHQDVHGNGTFFLLLQGIFDNVFGTGSADNITGNTVDNVISTDVGDDIINGGGGNDTLAGGIGNDVINGDDGADTIDGGTGNDTLNGGIGNDTLDGGAGTDIVNGDAGNDTLLQSMGSDTLDGGADIDTFLGTTGDNTFVVSGNHSGGGSINPLNVNTFTNVENINGNDGNDTVNYTTTNSRANFDGGAGIDTLRITLTTDAIVVVQSNNGGTLNTLLGGGGTFTATENLTGSDAGWEMFVIESGGAVTGTINGGTGAGAGDTLSYESRTTDVTVNLAIGTATDVGAVTGIEEVRSGAGNDSITGNTVTNWLYGGAGCDTLDGGSGTDNVYGGWLNLPPNGKRDDTCGDTIIDTDNATDFLHGGNLNLNGRGDDLGNDVFNVSGTALNFVYGGNANYNGGEGNDLGQDTLNMGAGTSGEVYGGNLNTTPIPMLSRGSDGNDTINLLTGSQAIRVYGGNRNDGLGIGTDGGDIINDNNSIGNEIHGGNYNNSTNCSTATACADNGNDVLTENSTAFNSLYGGNYNTGGSRGDDTGNDTITMNQSTSGAGYGGNNNEGTGSRGSDTGNDTLSVGGSSPITLYGGNRNFNGGSGWDTGSDTLTDNSTNPNNIHGGNGNYSAACNATNNCSDGNDTLIDNAGGVATDNFYGGNHNFEVGSVGNDGSDTITLNAGTSGAIVYGGNWNENGVGTDASDVIIDNNAAANTLLGGNLNALGNAACTATTCADGADTITDGAPADANIIAGGNTIIGNDGADIINTADGDAVDTVRPDNGNGTGGGGATIIADNATLGNQ